MRYVPDRWLVTVTVERTGGRDERGDLRPSTTFPVEDCLIGWYETSDGAEFTETTRALGRLYRRSTDVAFLSSDVVIIGPGTYLPEGRYRIVGEPRVWPEGTELWLEREKGS